MTTICENLRPTIVIFPCLQELSSRPISLDHYSDEIGRGGPAGLSSENTNYRFRSMAGGGWHDHVSYITISIKT